MSKRGGAPPPGLEAGLLVEAAPAELKGCWFEAEVLELAGADALVAFTTREAEEGDGPAQEWHKARDLRWTPPDEPIDGFPYCLERTDRCDLRYEDGWWECTVISIHPDPDGGPTEWVLRPTHYNEKHRVGAERMRPPWAWRNDEWTIPYNSKARHIEVYGKPAKQPRRPDAPTLPPGVARLARADGDAGAKGGGAGGGGGGGGAAAKARGVDEDGFGPPEARPSSFAEGTWRPGLDGRQWVVVHSPDNGASVWALRDQAAFFIERAKREQLQKKEKKRRESKAAALAASIKVAQQSVVQQYQLRGGAMQGTRSEGRAGARGAGAAGGAGGAGAAAPLSAAEAAAARELANVVCAMDWRAGGGGGRAKPGAKGVGGAPPKDRASAEHERVLRMLEVLIRAHGEEMLGRIPAEVLQVSEGSASGLAGVYARERDGFYDVQAGGRNLGRCDSALKAGQLRALYLQVQADLSEVSMGLERAPFLEADGGEAPAPQLEGVVEPSPTLDGLILGRGAQLERQRQFAHLVASPKLRAQLGEPEAEADAVIGMSL